MRCGKRPAKPGKTLCRECQSYITRWGRKRYTRRPPQTAFKAWAIQNGYHACEIADAIGVSYRTVHAWMQGRQAPSRAAEKRLAEAFKVDTTKFWGVMV